jgi:hypothetical protein
MSMLFLTAIPNELMSRYGRTPSYEKIRKAAIDARLPAVQAKNGRWQADPADVAELFELTEPVAA